MSTSKRRFRRIVESSDSDETAARVTDLVDLPQLISDTDSSDEDHPRVKAKTTAVNPFAYAMQHGKFPVAQPASEQQHPEPPELADTGYLWNAVPPKTSQYLDLEAAHVGSEISEGSTGSSDGSLSDATFIDKETPDSTHSAEDLQVLQKLFPKTFCRENLIKRSPQCRYTFPESVAQKNPVMVNGIINFPVWKRGPVSQHPLASE